MPDPAGLLDQGFAAVVVAGGLDRPLRLGIPGDARARAWLDFLEAPGDLAGQRVLVVGGGAVAVDCAVTARRSGAASVEVAYRRRLADMPLTGEERAELLREGIDVLPRTRLVALEPGGARTVRLRPAPGSGWGDRRLEDEPGTEGFLPADQVVYALGATSGLSLPGRPGCFPVTAGGSEPGTVVEAVAAGKNTAREVLAWLAAEPLPAIPDRLKGPTVLRGRNLRPVPLDADFFGRPIRSPFLLSAAPHTDGYGPVAAAYRAGWAGAVMKTAFDGLPIHVPGGYMSVFPPRTFGNCDNVSAHPLERVCREVERLVREFPDRLTLASTGGPVTGDDAADAAVWASNTCKLEAAGAMGVEYSLSCPQGGDGTHGDLVSQDPALTGKVVGWVLAAGDPAVPKLFKLTGAVTAIGPVLAAVREAFAQHPEARAGVTLANSFPALDLRSGPGRWEAGVVVGLSGEGITPISRLTLARAARWGLVVSGNGGPMDPKAAADFLALGARTVQFCSIALKHGLGVVEDLESGLSHLLAARGYPSVAALVGAALPELLAFEALSPEKGLPEVDPDLCEACGNCVRCGYQAIALDGRGRPVADPARCVGCSLCVQKCFAGALRLRRRTPAEAAALDEAWGGARP